jgi:hypothetical protein
MGMMDVDVESGAHCSYVSCISLAFLFVLGSFGLLGEFALKCVHACMNPSALQLPPTCLLTHVLMTHLRRNVSGGILSFGMSGGTVAGGLIAQ